MLVSYLGICSFQGRVESLALRQAIMFGMWFGDCFVSLVTLTILQIRIRTCLLKFGTKITMQSEHVWAHGSTLSRALEMQEHYFSIRGFPSYILSSLSGQHLKVARRIESTDWPKHNRTMYFVAKVYFEKVVWIRLEQFLRNIKLFAYILSPRLSSR
jgi:hypothetical protein